MLDKLVDNFLNVAIIVVMGAFITLIVWATFNQMTGEQLTPKQAKQQIPEKYHAKQLAEAAPIPPQPKPRFEKQWITNLEPWPVSQRTYIVRDNILHTCVWVIETYSGAVSQQTSCEEPGK